MPTAKRLIAVAPVLVMTALAGCRSGKTAVHQDDEECCGRCPPGQQCFSYYKLTGPTCGCFIPCHEDTECPADKDCHYYIDEGVIDHAPVGACVPRFKEALRHAIKRHEALHQQSGEQLRPGGRVLE